MVVDPKTDKLIRRTTMVATVVATYLLLTADYGPQDNALAPIKRAIESAESSLKSFVFGSHKANQETDKEKAKAINVK